MSTLDIKISHERNNDGDLRSSSPGFGTALLDVLTLRNRIKLDGYSKFLLCWQLVAKHLRLAAELKVVRYP